jgi:hypothetical protein
MYKWISRISLLFLLSLNFSSCDELVQAIEDNEQPTIVEDENQPQKAEEKEVEPKGADQPARKNFTDKDMTYKGESLRFTRHGRCRSECRHLDPYEIQEVIDQGKINKRKTNYAGKPCPAIAYEGTTSDGQKARIVVGACEGDYRVITVIDLDGKWKCSCD